MEEIKISNPPIAVYHWWSFPEEPPVYQNLRTPIITSIATLRAVSDIEIVVLDGSDHHVEWGSFPNKLKFKVQKWPLSLSKYQNKIEGWRHLSRIFDICNWSSYRYQQNIMYVDSDVFFLRNPFPLACDTEKFCWDGWNTGFFYFNNCTPTFREFYGMFCTYCKAAIFSDEIRDLMKKHVGYDAWYGVWDEMILGFMKHNHADLFNLIPYEEHTTCAYFGDCNNPKIFHANGSLVKNPLTNEEHARGLIGIIFSEFYHAMESVLSQDDLIIMYGDLLEHYKDKRVSLLKYSNLIQYYKNEQGLYDLNNLLRQIPVM